MEPMLVFVDPDVLRQKLPTGSDPLKLLLKWEAQAIEQGWDVDFYISRKFSRVLQSINHEVKSHVEHHTAERLAVATDR